MKSTLLYIVLVLVLVSGCKNKEIQPPVNNLTDYFPLETGRYVVYDVQYITYTNKEADSSNYQIKEINKGEFADQQGQTNYRMERYKRTDSNSEWEIDSVWTVISKPDRIIKVENNIPFVKLVFPIDKKTTWDANQMNNRQINTSGYNYKLIDSTYYENIAQPTAINGTGFQNTVKVMQNGNRSSIDSLYAYNIYAKDIGRIYTYNISMKLCNRSDSQVCTDGQKIDGFVIVEKYVEHGKE